MKIKYEEKKFADECFENGMIPSEFQKAFIEKFGYANEKLFSNYFEAF